MCHKPEQHMVQFWSKTFQTKIFMLIFPKVLFFSGHIFHAFCIKIQTPKADVCVINNICLCKIIKDVIFQGSLCHGQKKCSVIIHLPLWYSDFNRYFGGHFVDLFCFHCYVIYHLIIISLFMKTVINRFSVLCLLTEYYEFSKYSMFIFNWIFFRLPYEMSLEGLHNAKSPGTNPKIYE